MPKSLNDEVKFTKYEKRGAYHWESVSNSPIKHSAPQSAKYRSIIKLLPKNITKGRILDVGCGDGVLCHLLSRKKTNAVGMDSDRLAIEFAKQKAKSEFMVASAYHLPFSNESFDIVVSTEVIEHLAHPQKMIKAIKRVAKKNGTVIISTPIRLPEIPKNPMHVFEFTPEELKKLLEKYFCQVRTYQIHSLLLHKLYSIQPIKLIINILSILKINLFLIFKIGCKRYMIARCNGNGGCV